MSYTNSHLFLAEEVDVQHHRSDVISPFVKAVRLDIQLLLKTIDENYNVDGGNETGYIFEIATAPVNCNLPG